MAQRRDSWTNIIHKPFRGMWIILIVNYYHSLENTSNIISTRCRIVECRFEEEKKKEWNFHDEQIRTNLKYESYQFPKYVNNSQYYLALCPCAGSPVNALNICSNYSGFNYAPNRAEFRESFVDGSVRLGPFISCVNIRWSCPINYLRLVVNYAPRTD